MNDEEKYWFDLYGYIVVKEALDAEHVAALNALLDEKIATHAEPTRTTFRFGGLLAWGQPYREVIANPKILPYLETIIGTRCRLDHDYFDVIRGGLGPVGATLHGGGTPHDVGQFYRFADGRMYNGLTVVAYALKDVNPGDGGFACVPASHKANYRLPPNWADMSERLAPGVTPVPCRAGDAVIFTEALTHGTLPWHGKDERRTVFLKYNPHQLAWSSERYEVDAYDDLSLEARRLLEGPNARYKGRQGGVE
jgi:ectoine hydroxylase-related dioxygenase (phytanoyl-CoA dioxygenase family)